MYDANIPPPKPRPNLTDRIEGLPAKRSLYIPKEESSAESVRTIVTRVRSKFRGKRSFQTAKDGNGIRVWRTA